MGVVAIFVYKVQLTRTTSELCQYYRPVRLAYQPPASSTFLSEQISHQQPASSTFLSEQISTSHQPPAKRTGCMFLNMLNNKNTMASCNCVLSNISVTRIRRSDCWENSSNFLTYPWLIKQNVQCYQQVMWSIWNLYGTSSLISRKKLECATLVV
jgi:hypothetical protein